ncbi:MAG TPA: EF-hand domain-containing protein [Candidatus Poseidoniales archaeon]|jgi:Ca2+-binding EF-hand superfamily protein|nr:MAG TPA: EF-hand domain-containing protein [Candidatus Poseidoniales archaeon]HII78246.1 EF-hand domain-containing protein [Poseidonia sp.]|tara:strand:- start:378 stop:653 length:276 start_codon:yes stop_codon:yes gene_type:complete
MSDDAWTADEALSNLRKALGEKGMSVDDMFGQFDADSDGTINGPELHHGIRDMLGDVLSPGQISQIIKALDANEDHRIDLAELRQALQEEE